MKSNLGISRRKFLRACGVTGAGLATGLHRGLLKAAPCPNDGTPASGNIHVGLDIGSSKVCAAVAEQCSDGSLRLLGIGEAPSRASKWGLSDPEGTRRSVREALINAEVNSDVMIGSVALGLKAGPQGRLRNPWALLDFLHEHEEDETFAEALFETEHTCDDFKRLVDFARYQEDALLLDLHGVRLLAHAPDAAYSRFGNPVRNPSATRSVVEAAVSTAFPRSDMRLTQPPLHPLWNDRAKYVPYAGFWNDDPLVEVAQTVIAPLATAEAVLSREDKNRGALIIDMGAGTTHFTVFADGLVHTDCIQVGGRYLAIDVPPELMFRLERLERLPASDNCVEAGKCCAAGRTGAARKKTRDHSLDSFDSMRVMHTFELVKARLELRDIRLNSLRAAVHLTGGYSVFPDMPLFAKWMLGIPAQIGRVKGISGCARLLNDPRYSCALGMTKLAHGGQIE